MNDNTPPAQPEGELRERIAQSLAKHPDIGYNLASFFAEKVMAHVEPELARLRFENTCLKNQVHEDEKRNEKQLAAVTKERDHLRSELDYIAKFCNGSCNEYLMEIERIALKALKRTTPPQADSGEAK